jgi:phosphotriesterase-related protein
VAAVSSVRGPIDTADLGRTLMHEHLMINSSGIAENWPALFDEDAYFRAAEQGLKQREAIEMDTLVDVTNARYRP